MRSSSGCFFFAHRRHSFRIFRLMKFAFLLFLVFTFFVGHAQSYTMPGEHTQHEGTWIAWPHANEYGPWFILDVEPTSVALADALQEGENVHIIVWDEAHELNAKDALSAAGVPLTNLYFHRYQTNDLWTRDMGPVFVFSEANELTILDWGFNGWGEDTEYLLDDVIPFQIYEDHSLPYVDLSAMVLEGGALEQDGNGTFMATRSSVTHASRNPSLSEAEIEDYLEQYLGVDKMIWLDGVYGLEITDQHIDGFVKFANESTIVTMDSLDLIAWDVLPTDIVTLYNAQNVDGENYNFVSLPLTQNNVVTTYGANLGYKGSYVNYYIGNQVIVVPTYSDPNDALALSILEGVHPDRTVIGIDVRDLYAYGGMIHCITQQRPFDPAGVGVYDLIRTNSQLLQNQPNPFSEETTIGFELKEAGMIEIDLINPEGKGVKTLSLGQKSAGKHEITLNLEGYPPGIYQYSLLLNGIYQDTKTLHLVNQ